MSDNLAAMIEEAKAIGERLTEDGTYLNALARFALHLQTVATAAHEGLTVCAAMDDRAAREQACAAGLSVITSGLERSIASVRAAMAEAEKPAGETRH